VSFNPHVIKKQDMSPSQCLYEYVSPAEQD